MRIPWIQRCFLGALGPQDPALASDDEQRDGVCYAVCSNKARDPGCGPDMTEGVTTAAAPTSKGCSCSAGGASASPMHSADDMVSPWQVKPSVEPGLPASLDPRASNTMSPCAGLLSSRKNPCSHSGHSSGSNVEECPDEHLFSGIDLTTFLGKGAFAVVYGGRWQGTRVAVKVSSQLGMRVLCGLCIAVGAMRAL